MTAHRAWSLVGVTPVGGHSGNGFGLCAYDWKASGVSLLGTGTLGASFTDGGFGALAQAINGSTAAGNGWYSGDGHGFTNDRIWYDFGALTLADPDTVTLCSLNGFSWSIGQEFAIEWTDDDPAASPTWHRDYVVAATGADNSIQSFPIVQPVAASAAVQQLSAIVPADSDGGEARVSQFAYVAVFSETPPFAAGALVAQYAMVVVMSSFGNPSQAMMGTF